MPERSIVYMAWGESFIQNAATSIAESELPDYPIYVVTDHETDTSILPSDVTVLRHDFRFSGKLGKLDLVESLPADIATLLFLDVDTRVLGDITLGFDKAEIHGMALAAAPHYSLERFRNFGKVMDLEHVPRHGQMLYNSGVMFLAADRSEVRRVFSLASEIAFRHGSAPWGDQPYITLALEKLDFNPYTLSISFNHRAFGELVSDPVRIWHSYTQVAPGAATLAPGSLYRYKKGVMTRALSVPIE